MQLTYSHKVSRGWALRQSAVWLWLTLATVFVLIFAFPVRYDLDAGDVAPQNIRSPLDFEFESAILTGQQQDYAVRQVQPVYTPPDSGIARLRYEHARRVLAYLDELRADVYATEAQAYAWVLVVPELGDLSLTTVNTLLKMPDANWTRTKQQFLYLLDQIMRQQRIREEDLEDVRASVPSLVALDLASDEAVVVADLVKRFLVPNVFYDEQATQRAIEQARDAVKPVKQSYRRGEVIVRDGSRVTDLNVEVLRHLGDAVQTRDWLEIGMAFLLAGVAVFSLGFYFWRFYPIVLDKPRLEVLFALLVTLFLALARVLIIPGDLLPYLFPGAALAMLLTTTSGLPVAVGTLVFVGGICGWMAGPDLGFAVMVMLSGLTAALTLPKYEQTGSIFRSGLASGLAGAASLLAFNAAELRGELVPLWLKIAVCLASGAISGGLTVGGLFLLAPIFDLTTTFRLTELSRPNHPLLQRLLRETPATFNHVMMVASLAEQAAERIGANALLTRVGAYYHDIGKLLRPYFFAENQQGLSNPHDRLDAYTSVDVLKGHIRDGQKLAREFHLPVAVRAFINEHHGTMQASFFYRKAVEAAGGEADLVDENQFRYPGPVPQSKETLLVMLADGSEAATRARRPSTPEALADVVDAIFDYRMKDGQLDECDITMKELHVVKATYIDLLRGAFHPRVQYPEPKKSE